MAVINWFIRKFTAIILTMVVVGLAAFIFLRYIYSISLPGKYEEENLTVIIDSLKIYENPYGIPHIISTNEKDAFFAIGYCHARHRLWQMDYLRRSGRGQLAEIFGKGAIRADKYMRTIELGNIAEKIWRTLDKHSKTILESYSNGVNAYIESHKKELPVEFARLDYYPEKWKPTDCLVIQRKIAFDISISAWLDLVLGELAEKIGPIKAMELIANYPNSAPYILDSAFTYKMKIPLKKDTLLLPSKIISSNNKSSLKNLFSKECQTELISCYSEFFNNHPELFNSHPAIFNSHTELLNSHPELFNSHSEQSEESILQHFPPKSIACNSWVIKKSKSLSSASILANDIHFQFLLPSFWYQLHVSCPSFNVVGFTIPGFPMFVVGRNEKIAWGFTGSMLDDFDYFIEKIDSTNSNYYIDSTRKKNKFLFIKDTINIKNSEPFFYYKKSVNRSMVISDFHILNYRDTIINLPVDTNFVNKFLRKYCLTFNWTGKRISNEINALYNISKSNSWSGFTKSLNTWGSPCLIFTYGDNKGNVGITTAGILPIRDKNCNNKLPNPGWLSDYDWKGFQKANYLYLYNPIKNFIVSANNKISRDYQSIPAFCEPSSRSERIEELLAQFYSDTTIYEYSVKDAKRMQNDVYSPYARQMLSHVIPALNKQELFFNGVEKAAFLALKKWDCLLYANKIAPSIYSAFIERYVYNTFADKLGKRLYREYVMHSGVSLAKIMELTESDSSAWFNDSRTPLLETRDRVIVESFRDAVKNLTLIFETEDILKWKYGLIHKLTLNHTFSSDDLLKYNVTLGPHSLGGDKTTLNNAEWCLFEPFNVTSGSSMRFITDLSEKCVYMSIPAGASGDPLSAHYGDQILLWLNGGYLKILIDVEPGEDNELRVLLLPKLVTDGKD